MDTGTWGPGAEIVGRHAGSGIAPWGIVWPFVCVLVCASGCAAGILPGARWDAGGVTVQNRDGGEARGRWSVGTHLNSHLALPVEVGVGYQAEHATVFGPPSSPGAKPQMDGGPYVEVAGRMHESHAHRSFLGLRGSVLWPVEDPAELKNGIINMALRADFEFFTKVSGAGAEGTGGGFVAGLAQGILAVGAYAESGYRRDPDGTRSFVATAGLTIRTPFLVGMAMDFRLLR